jgi:hypothetical protein
MKVLTLFTPIFCHFLTYSSKYSLQNPVLKYLPATLCPYREEPSFIPTSVTVLTLNIGHIHYMADYIYQISTSHSRECYGF